MLASLVSSTADDDRAQLLLLPILCWLVPRLVGRRTDDVSCSKVNIDAKEESVVFAFRGFYTPLGQLKYFLNYFCSWLPAEQLTLRLWHGNQLSPSFLHLVFGACHLPHAY